MCMKISNVHGEDLFQEVSELLLTIEESKLPKENYFNWWFYRTVSNMANKTGQYGKLFKERQYIEDLDIDITDIEQEVSEVDYDNVEDFMFSLGEFENRIVHLYNEYGNMKRVQKATGISYSALRKVKDKLKQQR